MSNRQQIAEMVRIAYAARVAGDVDGVLAHFADDAVFAVEARGAGHEAMLAPVRGQARLRATLQALVDAFRFEDWTQVALIVEGDQAALHWRGKVTSRATGRSDMFDVVDIIGVQDGKITSLHQSFDTARLNALAA